MIETPYYWDLLSKLATNVNGITHDELCCHRLDYRTFEDTMNWLIDQGFVVEVLINNKKGYKSTYEGNMHVINKAKENREREAAKKDPNSIREIIDTLNACWISVEKLLPENATEITFTNLNVNFKFVTVLVKDDCGHIGIRNRILQTPTGNQYLDASIETTDWHWSKDSFEPTHWMPLPR